MLELFVVFDDHLGAFERARRSGSLSGSIARPKFSLTRRGATRAFDTRR
jgi:hypothetical protein